MTQVRDNRESWSGRHRARGKHLAMVDGTGARKGKLLRLSLSHSKLMSNVPLSAYGSHRLLATLSGRLFVLYLLSP